MKTALEQQSEETIFAILRELERQQISTYQLVEMGYSLDLIDLLSRIRHYILKSEERRERK